MKIKSNTHIDIKLKSYEDEKSIQNTTNKTNHEVTWQIQTYPIENNLQKSHG